MTELVIWIACALICYTIAKNKGRDPILAFALGLLFGVIAVVIYLLIKGSPEYELEKAQKKVEAIEKRIRKGGEK